MPIRSSQRHRYPANWRDISLSIRARSLGRCECQGECGLHHGRRCEERQGQPAQWAKGRVVLTVAHLDHQPENCDHANLKAMCQRCHLRYDADLHRRQAARTRREHKRTREMFATEEREGER